MRTVYWQNFLKYLDTFNDYDHLLAKIALEAAPTMSGVKPSTLMTFTKTGRNLYELWHRYCDEVQHALPLQCFELRRTNDFVVVLFYRPGLLAQTVNEDANAAFLRSMGYTGELELPAVLATLKLRTVENFPHEIGLLLGIPLADVVGFIRNKGEACLLCGYWKVYGDPHTASRLFSCYDKAKKNIIRQVCRQQALLKAIVA